MLTTRGLGRVLGDLAALGYDARWGVLGACDAGAPHQRDRIWIVGTLVDSDCERRETGRRLWAASGLSRDWLETETTAYNGSEAQSLACVERASKP